MIVIADQGISGKNPLSWQPRSEQNSGTGPLFLKNHGTRKMQH